MVNKPIGYGERKIRLSLSPRDIFWLAVILEDTEYLSWVHIPTAVVSYKTILLYRLAYAWERYGLSRQYEPCLAISNVLKADSYLQWKAKSGLAPK